jgi:hypothetical protein
MMWAISEKKCRQRVKTGIFVLVDEGVRIKVNKEYTECRILCFFLGFILSNSSEPVEAFKQEIYSCQPMVTDTK